MKNELELGAEVSAAAGPAARNHAASTDARMPAAILTYSRSRGLFAGANVKGIVLKPEDDLNMTIYKKTARELLSEETGEDATATAGLKPFPQALARYTAGAVDAR